jgi:hypothetical protein
MTADDFRQSLTAANRRRNSRSLSPAYGGMPKVIGLGPTNLLSRTKAPEVRVFTPTCTARKATRATQAIGTVVPASLFAENHSTPSGSPL